jgi:hypothetical protein
LLVLLGVQQAVGKKDSQQSGASILFIHCV